MLKQLLLCSLALGLLLSAADVHARRKEHKATAVPHSAAPVTVTADGVRAQGVPEATARAVAGPESDAAESPPPEPAGNLDDATALSAFLDGAMRVGMERHHVTGAVVAIVKDGKVLLAKGYGRANLAQGTPIDPATSLFRVGSITKLFTWTAVMQQVDDGKLNLDEDVNSYLHNIHIPQRFGKPVTLRTLMTHTAGFEDASLGFLMLPDAKRQAPMASELAFHMPERVRPPGELPAYSNYGAALAGLIVEQSIDEPYNDYIDKRIFAPLGMLHSTVQEPVPDRLSGNVTTAYRFTNGMEQPQPFEVMGAFRPALSASVSALDMTHFMLANLGDGSYQGHAVLQPETVKLMHTAQVKADLRLPGMALGFYEEDINGLRALAQAGDTIRYHSDLVLLPTRNFGIFLSFITEDEAVRGEIEQAFFARYFPPASTGPARLDDTIALLLAQKYSGDYQWTRRNYSGFEKLLNLVQSVHVSSIGNGNILVRFGLGSEPLQFEPVSSDLYREVLHKQLQVAFRKDAADFPTHLFVNNLPYMPAERTPWHEQPLTWALALGIAFLVLTGVLASTYYRWQEIRAMPPQQQLAMGAAASVAGWAIATALVIGGVLGANRMEVLLMRIPTMLKVGLAMPVVFLGLTAWLLVMTVLAWKDSYWSLGRRLGYSVVPLVALVLCAFLVEWNLLWWRFG